MTDRRRRGELAGKPLSGQEVACLAAYARLGWVQGVADELGISGQTVKNHLSRVYEKLGAHSGIDAFHKLGWLDNASLLVAQRTAAVERLAAVITEATALLDQMRTPDSTPVDAQHGVPWQDPGRESVAVNPASSHRSAA